jgi:hypothetical protein
MDVVIMYELDSVAFLMESIRHMRLSLLSVDIV